MVCHDTLGVNLAAWVDGSHHDLIAALLVLAITAVLCLGVKISSRINAAIVAVKLTWSCS